MLRTLINKNIAVESNRPRVGVGIMIFRRGKILLGKRRGSHGSGEYAFPGGHLEYLESFESCAKREIEEECGIKVKNLRFQYVANVTKYAPKHYVHIGLVADWRSGESKVLEPDKLESWNWYDIDNLPKPLFEMCKMAINFFKSNKNYCDIKNRPLASDGGSRGKSQIEFNDNRSNLNVNRNT